MTRKIIVVGGNAAGPAAAAMAKRTAPDAEVTMIESGRFISTGTCELPYLLSGEINDYKNIVFFDDNSFEREKGVKVLTSHSVDGIDRNRKTVSVRNLQSGHSFVQSYDKLVLCTGSIARRISALPVNLSNVFKLKSVSDFILINSYLEKKKVKNVLIIGAGYIGLEAAEALKLRGCGITIIDKEKNPLPGLELETRLQLKNHLAGKGIDFFNYENEIKFHHDGTAFRSLRYDGRIMEFDLVLVSIGFEPNNSLALSSKLEIGRTGGIKVDQKLKTSDPNIFAAGDCIEVVNKITGRPDYIPLATIAFRTGHNAGANAAGGNLVSGSFVKNIAVKLLGKSITSVGLSSEEASASQFKFSSVQASMPNLVKVMPGSEEIFGKILFDKNSRFIIGANFIGNSEVVGYADLISSFIQNKISASELGNIQFNYTPPLSPFVNILTILGKQIQREFK